MFSVIRLWDVINWLDFPYKYTSNFIRNVINIVPWCITCNKHKKEYLIKYNNWMTSYTPSGMEYKIPYIKIFSIGVWKQHEIEFSSRYFS